MNKPTVSQLLDLISKPALIKWSNKIGLEGISLDEYRKKAFASGSNKHKQIEDYLKSGKEIENELLRKMFLKFISDKKVIDCEVSVENEYYFGRYDIKFEYNGKIYIGDFKSSNKVYQNNRLQLMAYKLASEGAEKVCIISLIDFNMTTVRIKDEREYEQTLRILSELYQLKHVLGL